jgi:DNA polymerase-3 subunit gamma/tau
MLYKAAPDAENIAMYSQDKTVLSEQSAKFSHDELAGIIQTLHEAANEAKWAVEPRITAEIALISICRRAGSQEIAYLLDRITELENKVSGLSSGAQIAHQVVNQPPKQPQAHHTHSYSEHPVNAQPTHAPQKPAEAVPIAPCADGGNLKEVWEAVLKELIHTGKRSVHACITQGNLIRLDEKEAIVQFTAAFPKERTEKEDYRAIVEKIFMQVYGKAVQLICILGTSEAPKPPSPKAETKVRQAENPPETQHPALKQALMMFGGKVIQQEDK